MRRHHLALTLAVLIGAAHAAYAAWDMGPTYDEPFYLGWTARFLDTGSADRSKHFTDNSKTPIMLPNVLLGRVVHAAGAGAHGVLFAQRLVNLIWYGLAILFTFVLARSLTDPIGGALAASVVALDLNMVANSSVATIDAAFAAMTIATAAAALRLAERPSATAGALFGAAIGAAIGAKFTGVLLVSAALLLPLARPADIPLAPWLKRVLPALLVSSIVACLALGAIYLGHEIGKPLGETAFLSRPMSGLAARLPWLRPPLPLALLTGIDVTLAHERNIDWNSYLFGRLWPSGVWYYFPIHWALKTPILIVIGILAALIGGLRSREILRLPKPRFLFALSAVLGAYFCFVFRPMVGFRYVLMCVPLAIVLSAPSWRRWLEHSRGPWLVGLAIATMIFGHLFYFGNPIAYTNCLVFPKARAFKLIADSNIDFGQYDDRLDEVSRKTGVPLVAINPKKLYPGLNAIGINNLTGVFLGLERYRWLRENVNPVGHYRHTYVLFDLDLATYARYLDTLDAKVP